MTTHTDAPSENISPIAIEDEMQASYLDYAMSVIVSRALPDVRDGLKPVHRRILYAMKDGGYDSSKPYKKSARIVGDVMGKYHPHGDSAIYDAMVRMAQDFSMRLPLVDGQGNFGSMDGDSPAAMRYTEARLEKVAETLLDDIDKDTVDFSPNYDESVYEPRVLPARFPNLLVNGTGGIAVGMATNIPPHNLGEIIEGCLALIENPDLGLEELIQIIPGPDFPTGAEILGRNGILSAYNGGRGSVVVRSKTSIETMRGDREAIIVHEIPFQVNKSRLVERIGEVAREKIIEGISALRDETDRDGVRIVIEIKKDAIADIVLNQLYKHTPLQTSFGCNMLALHHGRPQMMNLKQILQAFLEFREVVITRRTAYELRKAREKAHTLAGLAVAVVNIDAVIAIIRNAPDPATAREKLRENPWPAGDIAPLIELVADPQHMLEEDGTYRLSEDQAKAILDLRLHRLTGLEREKIAAELKDITDRIREYLHILSDRDRLLDVMRGELFEIKENYATPRRTALLENEFEVDIEDLIQREDMVVTVSHAGYVKRVPLSAYRAQKRGGKGRTGMNTKDEDFVTELFVASTHTPMLLFTSRGIVHKMKVYQMPVGTPQSRGKAFVNLLPLEKGETISVVMPLPEDEEAWDNLDVVFATSHGTIRRNTLEAFRNIRKNGLIAMKLDEETGEKLIDVRTCTEDSEIMLASRKGKAIRFPLSDVRVFKSRASTGVRGIKLGKGDEVVSISVLQKNADDIEKRNAYLKAAAALRGVDDDGDTDPEIAAGGDLSAEEFAAMAEKEDFILTVTTKGFGKRTSSYEYRTSGRGGQGVWNMKLGKKNGEVARSFCVENGDQIMMVTNGGQIIRMPVEDIRFAGRQTQGVTLFRIAEGEEVVSVALIPEDEEEDDNGDNGNDGDNADNGNDSDNGNDAEIPETDAPETDIKESE
ncbi:MAG: DNA gyrase subunit A [Micavibrio sp.]|nr:MAG: DNA gyrase subunit A [Micavibrio sp.]